MERIQRIIGFLRAQSLKIVLTGDVNSPAGATDSHGSVWAMLERNDMAVRARHIDVIAYTPDLVPVERCRWCRSAGRGRTTRG